MPNIKRGFTLAEVLITLMVIGVLAVITIPSLLQSWQETQFKSALKKQYSILSQAFIMVTLDNDSTFKGLCLGNYTNSKCVRDYFTKYLKTAKYCNVSWNEGCWAKEGEWYYLNGQQAGILDNGPNKKNAYPGIILQDGSFISFANWDGTCTASINSVPVCGYIMTDINGIKPPNTVGKDIFTFYIQEHKITSVGSVEGASYYHSCLTSGTGWGCATKVLGLY